MAAAYVDPVGTLAVALAHARRLLGADPALAEAQAREILAVIPGQVDATLLLCDALRSAGRAREAVEVLRPFARVHTPAYVALGLALAQAGKGAEAIAALERAVAAVPADPEAWRALGDQRSLAGDVRGADAAYAAGLRVSSRDPMLVQAATALADNRLAAAEPILRDFLKRHPTDVAAMRMLAELAARLGRYADAEALLTRALELAPSFAAARHNLALVLYRQNRASEALSHLDQLRAGDPGSPVLRNLTAAALGQVGDYARAVALWEALLADYPEQPKAWMSYGHALKTIGRATDSAAAYARAVDLAPELGEAWWSLANLKVYRFTAIEADRMRALLAGELADIDRLHLEFALGKAAEDAGDAAGAFAPYARANALGRVGNGYDPAETTAHVDRSSTLLTPAFFAARAGGGDPSPDPIFIVGLPRAGSTLIEQILASHSQVEGTMELPELVAIARRLGERRRPGDPTRYPEVLSELRPDECTALGREYLDRTRIYRKTERPFFVDKMPNNWAHVVLIQLILPNARIVDARRHPLANGFSAWKQHFARGQGFTYDLGELGRYTRDYVRLMAVIDRTLPGRVHRVLYERLVTNTEPEVRALLGYCGLAFEAACLVPHESKRAVRTPSAEQVRRPITTDSVAQWQQYEQWLGPLADALGPVLDAYPAVPDAM